MTRRIIDISVPLQSDIASDPPGTEPKIVYFDHKQSAPQVCAFFPGLTPADLPDGEGWAVERIDISTHNGTHLDAPWHFASTMDRGKRGHHHRRGPARVVLPAGRQARLPPFPERLRGDARRRRGRIEAHRPYAAPARHRHRQHVGGTSAMASPTTCRRAAAWAGRPRSISPRAASRSPAPTPGHGTRPSSTRPKNSPRPKTPA